MNVSMVKGPMSIREITKMQEEAKKSRKVADKSVFGRIFENECKKMDGRAPSTLHIKEY